MFYKHKHDKTEKARGLGRKTRDRKGESNDSPEIANRRRHQTSPASLWVSKENCSNVTGNLEPEQVCF